MSPPSAPPSTSPAPPPLCAGFKATLCEGKGRRCYDGATPLTERRENSVEPRSQPCSTGDMDPLCCCYSAVTPSVATPICCCFFALSDNNIYHRAKQKEEAAELSARSGCHP
ncbi:hypothetical protein PAMP_009486 [Pampus punctatissimus]